MFYWIKNVIKSRNSSPSGRRNFKYFISAMILLGAGILLSQSYARENNPGVFGCGEEKECHDDTGKLYCSQKGACRLDFDSRMVNELSKP